MIAGVIPIDLLAQKRKHVPERRTAIGSEAAKKEARMFTYKHWQDHFGTTLE